MRPPTIYTKTPSEVMSREDAPGIRIGQQNDGASQQKTKFTLIMLEIT